jgi:hypothetical protein
MTVSSSASAMVRLRRMTFDIAKFFRPPQLMAL